MHRFSWFVNGLPYLIFFYSEGFQSDKVDSSKKFDEITPIYGVFTNLKGNIATYDGEM